MTKIINLQNVRRSLMWCENFDRIEPFYDALRNAEPDEAPVTLFRLARKHRDWNIGKRRAVFDVLRHEAHQAKVPDDEAEKIISAGLYRTKRTAAA